MRIEQTSKILIIVTGLVILSLVVVGAQLFWLIGAQSKPDLSRPADYVGSQQCRICHPRQYYAWHKTSHSRTLQEPAKNPNAIIGDFAISSQIRDFGSKEISYTIGGTVIQQYLKKAGQDYFLLPAQYDAENSRWLPLPPGVENKSFFEACAGCHSTGLNIKEKRFFEPGVGCEACHGPGSNHIIAPLAKKMETIVNPAQLAPQTAAMVCGSCHSGGQASQAKFAYPVDYRPGEQIAEKYHFVERNDADYFWPTGNAKEPPLHYLDWLKSQHSKAGVGCINCHTLHTKGNLNPYQTRLAGDELCLGCHTGKHTNAVHDAGSCISCHMPESIGRFNPGKIKSHTFEPIDPAAGKNLGSLFQQPDYCFSCHQE